MLKILNRDPHSRVARITKLLAKNFFFKYFLDKTHLYQTRTRLYVGDFERRPLFRGRSLPDWKRQAVQSGSHLFTSSCLLCMYICSCIQFYSYVVIYSSHSLNTHALNNDWKQCSRDMCISLCYFQLCSSVSRVLSLYASLKCVSTEFFCRVKFEKVNILC